MTFDLENRKWALISVTVADRAKRTIFWELALIRVIQRKKSQ